MKKFVSYIFILMLPIVVAIALPTAVKAQITGGIWGHYGNDNQKHAPSNGGEYRQGKSVVENIAISNLAPLIVSRTPDAGCSDKVKISWRGYINIPSGGNYKFGLDVAPNQWVRLEINNVRMIPESGEFHTGGVVEMTSAKFLPAGWKKIKLFTNTFKMPAGTCSTAKAELVWDEGVGTSPLVPVPASIMSPGEPPSPIITIPDVIKPKAQFRYKVSGIGFHEKVLGGHMSFSLAAWVRTSDSGGVVIHGEDPSNPSRYYQLRITSGQAEFFITDGSQTSLVTHPSPVSDNVKHLLVATFEDRQKDDVRINIFVDDDAPVSNIKKIGSLGTAAPLYVGANSSLSNYYGGVVDDIRLYNRALTAGEVEDLEDGDAVSSIGLLGRWRLDGNTSDSTRHNNPLIQIGGGTWVGGIVGSGALSLNGSGQHMRVDDSGKTDNVIEINLDDFVSFPGTVISDEVTVIWSDSSGSNLKVTKTSPSPGTAILAPNVTSRLDGTQYSSYAKFQAGFIPSSGILRLNFQANPPSDVLDVGGLALIVPYIDTSRPLGRLTLYGATEAAYNGLSPAAVFPIDGITNLEPLFMFTDGESVLTADYSFRPNYLVMASGNNLATMPGPFDALEGAPIGGSRIIPKIGSGPIAKYEEKKKIGWNFLPRAFAQIFPLSNPDSWYPVMGRQGVQFDLLSRDYVDNTWPLASVFSGQINSSILVPSGSAWVAFQPVSGNFPEDSQEDWAESIGFTAAVGIFTTLDMGQPASPDVLSAVIDCPFNDDTVITWSHAGADTTKYNIYRCTDGGAQTCTPSILVGTVPEAGPNSFRDASARAPLTWYGYTVRAYNGATSLESNLDPAEFEYVQYDTCIPPNINANISASPSRVPRGGFSTLSWSSNAPPADDCSITDDVTPDLINIPPGGPNCTADPSQCNGSQKVGPITGDTIFTMTCTPADTTETDAVTVSTSVLIFEEQ